MAEKEEVWDASFNEEPRTELFLPPAPVQDKPENNNSTVSLEKPAQTSSDENSADSSSNKSDKGKTDVPKKKIFSLGESKTIAPNVIAEVAKLESEIACNSEISEFLSLSFCSQKLLPKSKKKPASKVIPKVDTGTEEKKEITEDKETPKSSNSRKRSASRSPSPPRKKRSNNATYNTPVDEWYCELCQATANSIATWQSHLDGKRHLRKLAAANEEGDYRYGVVPQMQARPSELYNKVASFKRNPKPGAVAKLKAKLDVIKSPCVGLKYITEIWLLDEAVDPVYICSLCTSFCQMNSIINHIIGFKHRLAYTKIADPENYEYVKKLAKKSDLTQALERESEKLEDRDGRGELVVEEEVEGGNYSFEDYIRSYGGSAGDYRNFSSRDDLPNIQSLSSRGRMELLRDLVGSLEPYEISSDSDVFEIQHCMRNLTTALRRYVPSSFIPGLQEFLSKDPPNLKQKKNQFSMQNPSSNLPSRPLFPIQTPSYGENTLIRFPLRAPPPPPPAPQESTTYYGNMPATAPYYSYPMQQAQQAYYGQMPSTSQSYGYYSFS